MKTKLWARTLAALTVTTLSLSLVQAEAADKPASTLTVLHTFTDSPDGAAPGPTAPLLVPGWSRIMPAICMARPQTAGPISTTVPSSS
jgi:hypothetical protein